MQKSAAQTLPFILLALAALALASCVGTELGLGLGAEAAGIYLTRTKPLPPADTADQIAPHENWCYGTAGYTECYAHPQPGESNRLINVDPANRYPLTKKAYDQTVIDDQRPPVVVVTPGTVVVPAAPQPIMAPPGDAMPASPAPDLIERPIDSQPTVPMGLH